MFKVGYIVEQKIKNDLFPIIGNYWKVKDIENNTLIIISISTGFGGIELYVDNKNWVLNKNYYRKLKLKKICLKLEIK